MHAGLHVVDDSAQVHAPVPCPSSLPASLPRQSVVRGASPLASASDHESPVDVVVREAQAPEATGGAEKSCEAEHKSGGGGAGVKRKRSGAAGQAGLQVGKGRRGSLGASDPLAKSINYPDPCVDDAGRGA